MVHCVYYGLLIVFVVKRYANIFSYSSLQVLACVLRMFCLMLCPCIVHYWLSESSKEI